MYDLASLAPAQRAEAVTMGVDEMDGSGVDESVDVEQVGRDEVVVVNCGLHKNDVALSLFIRLIGQPSFHHHSISILLSPGRFGRRNSTASR